MMQTQRARAIKALKRMSAIDRKRIDFQERAQIELIKNPLSSSEVKKFQRDYETQLSKNTREWAKQLKICFNALKKA